MRREFTFYAGEVEGIATVELKFDESKNTFSACAYSAHWGGQCFDSLLEEMKEQKVSISPTFQKIYDLWERWHLNDMRAGSPKQEAFIKANIPEGARGYENVCKKLKESNLLEDESYIYNGKPYKYGTAWLKEEIPAEVVAEIKALMTTGKA